MAYSWDTEIAGEVKSRGKASSFHETDLLRGYVKAQASQPYSATPKLDDYLTLRLREGTNKKCSRCQEPSNKEICNTCMHRSANPEPANTSYGRIGNYDIGSKLGLYNPATSMNMDLYLPGRNHYQKEKD